PDIESSADGRACIVRGRLDVDVAEIGLLKDHSVRDTVQRYAAGQADRALSSLLLHVVHQSEVDLFEHLLGGGGQVHMARRNLGSRNSRLAKCIDELLGVDGSERRLAAGPSHLDAFRVMAEVVEVEADLIAFDAHYVADLIDEAGLAVRAEAHHFVLVTVLGESEELRKGGVEQTERVWEADAAGDFHLVAASDAPHHAAEVAEPVDREQGSSFEWRCENRTRHMSAVMLDEMNLSIVRAGHAAMFELLFDLRNAHAVRRPARRLAPRRRPCSDAPQF